MPLTRGGASFLPTEGPSVPDRGARIFEMVDPKYYFALHIWGNFSLLPDGFFSFLPDEGGTALPDGGHVPHGPH